MQSQDPQFVGVASNSIDSRSQRWAQASVWASRIRRIGLGGRVALRAGRRLGRRDVTAGDQCDDLLHRDRVTCHQLGEGLLGDLELLVDKSIRRRRGRAVAPCCGPRGERYRDLRLRRLNRQQHRVVDSARLFRVVRWVLASSR